MAELETGVSASESYGVVQVLFVLIEGATIGLDAMQAAGSGVRGTGLWVFKAVLRIDLMRMALFSGPLRVVSVPLEEIWQKAKHRSCCRDRNMMNHALYCDGEILLTTGTPAVGQ